jgi:ribosomal-protein-alanine N-acetyltransferase
MGFSGSADSADSDDQSGAVQVRRMRWWDVPQVHDIEVRSFPDTAWSIETFWAELAGVPETRRYWVAELAGSVVGYAGVMVVGPEADVQTIAVTPEHRGTGLGVALLARVFDEALRRECSQVMLEVAADNEAALRLYERHGFTSLAKRSNYYGPGRDALVMRSRLTTNRLVGDRDA